VRFIGCFFHTFCWPGVQDAQDPAVTAPSIDHLPKPQTSSPYYQVVEPIPHIHPTAEAAWYNLIFETETEDTVAPEVREHDVPDDVHAYDDLRLDNENVDWQFVDVLARLLPLDLAVDRDRFTAAYAVVHSGVDFVGDDTSTITPPTPTLPKHTEPFSDTASAPSVLDMIDALYDEADAALLDIGFVKRAPPALRRGPDN